MLLRFEELISHSNVVASLREALSQLKLPVRLHKRRTLRGFAKNARNDIFAVEIIDSKFSSKLSFYFEVYAVLGRPAECVVVRPSSSVDAPGEPRPHPGLPEAPLSSLCGASRISILDSMFI
jgi:hypothetical protein